MSERFTSAFKIARQTVAAILTMAAATGAAFADAPDERWITCVRTGALGGDYVNLTVDIERVEIASSEDDPGGSFEIRLGAGFSIFARDAGGKPTGQELCGALAPDWYFDLPIINIKTGPMQSYPVQKRLIINNVPRGAVALLNMAMWELDDTSGDDKGDFSPGEDLSGLHVWLYPDLGKGIVQPETATTFNLQFGKRKRVVGDNKGRFSDFAAGLEFTVTSAEPQSIGGAVGPAPKVGGAVPKVGGATGGVNPSPNMPSPGQPLNPSPNDHPQCRDYALKSVEQNQEQLKLGCGFFPPVWSSDHQMHFDWCVEGKNVQTTAGHLANRQIALDACKLAKGG